MRPRASVVVSKSPPTRIETVETGPAIQQRVDLPAPGGCPILWRWWLQPPRRFRAR
ncbi:hypothetical protein [Alloactinosynnema sp. L-07]|nr:hypothetical protein [Alloactinosynnema sp. L-07]